MTHHKDPELSIVVFAYNEAENVTAVLRELLQWLRIREPSSEVIFVDDGSSDGTADEVVRLAGKPLQAAEGADEVTIPLILVRHDKNRGIGAALKSGVARARGRWVTFLPADGQIPPEAIGMLRAAQADLVLSVYAHRDDGMHRKILSLGVRTFIALVHGSFLSSAGPYLFRRSLFIPEELHSDTFFLNFEFPLRVRSSRLPTKTVTIPCRPRRRGHSKVAKTKTVALIARDVLHLRALQATEWWMRTLGKAR